MKSTKATSGQGRPTKGISAGAGLKLSSFGRLRRAGASEDGWTICPIHIQREIGLSSPHVGSEDHWQSVYETKSSDAVSWYRPHLEHSLGFIQRSGLGAEARIVDVGGGASTLVDDLLRAGHRNLAVIDLAGAALQTARERLGEGADAVDWIVGDVTTDLLPDNSVDFWHDRAVFHFLTDEAARAAYLGQVARCVKPGGHVLVATFGLDGPEKCSGLPVARYDAAGIHTVFGDTFDKLGEASEHHETPWGSTQSFVYCFCRRSNT